MAPWNGGHPSLMLAGAVVGLALVAGSSAWIVQALGGNRRRERRLRAERELEALLIELKQAWREHMREPAVRVVRGGPYELGAQLGVVRGLVEQDYDSLGNTIVYLVKPGRK